MRIDMESVTAMLRLHSAVGAMLRAERAYDAASGDPVAEPAAFEARSAARQDVADAHRLVTKAMTDAALDHITGDA